MVNLNQAKARLGHYLKRVRSGERVIVCERNRPVAELKALPEAGQGNPLRIGVLAGSFEVPDDFDEALEELENDFYGNPPVG